MNQHPPSRAADDTDNAPVPHVTHDPGTGLPCPTRPLQSRSPSPSPCSGSRPSPKARTAVSSSRTASAGTDTPPGSCASASFDAVGKAVQSSP